MVHTNWDMILDMSAQREQVGWMLMKVEVGPAWQLESNKLGYIVDDTMLGKVQGKLKPVVVEMDVLGGEAGIEAA